MARRMMCSNRASISARAGFLRAAIGGSPACSKHNLTSSSSLTGAAFMHVQIAVSSPLPNRLDAVCDVPRPKVAADASCAYFNRMMVGGCGEIGRIDIRGTISVLAAAG
ncbi:hypothetical protein EJ03DRAFT_334342 [Teratosphaeria nubilosa]|uniref:Uncharacterized protein n=1 Tax=Teratosphaeria nubilosa TaxID=161662 RepID=A0A6G1LGQ3_9PEZI|nr:hypothetical protein EJ03DRAFT_334342 [Teratosphaeria nubilosa]